MNSLGRGIPMSSSNMEIPWEAGGTIAVDADHDISLRFGTRYEFNECIQGT